MPNLRCDTCGNKVEVNEEGLLFCSRCWLNEYIKLSRKETRSYGTHRSNTRLGYNLCSTRSIFVGAEDA
jgi:hypothetical protein